ncbi:terminase TerL endonuclease subunit [Belnapia sp. F-4-1]|uniref:terminase TerL endonuclease subunit n=1 Tax=Belnapia sp. F-4-1 TaxID=1545443 RepID=UPI00069135DF|nr:terminase TerL endonuclease subunit [Belnapia sp. F-4-1]
MAARAQADQAVAAPQGVAEAVAYAEAVVGVGAIPVGRLAGLACARFLRDRIAAEAGRGPWAFRPDLVEAALLFAGQMPNIKGPEAGQPLRCRSPDLRLEDFEGQECHLGLDLASRTDLAALALVFPQTCRETGKTTYAAFARCYLNEEAVLEARNAAYPGWAAAEHLVLTPGNETDFQAIEDDILEFSRRFRIVSVGYDPWQSTQLAQRLRAQDVEMVEFRSTTANFSPAIIELDAAMRSGRLQHASNPVLEWCIGNVLGKPDRRGNLRPTKARPEQQIDAAVALIMSVGRSMTEPKQFTSIFERAELWQV